MKNRAIAIIGLLTFLLASGAYAQTAAAHPDLASADWSLKQARALNAEPKDAVWKFINNLWGNTDLSPGNGKLCEFHFADLRHSGELSLVVSYDGGGTMDCNDVAVFDKSPVGIDDYDFTSPGMFWYDDIKDINGDGRYELIVDAIVAAPYGGARCWATWPVVYGWNGTGYADVSARFKGFYKETLAGLTRQLAAPASTPAPQPTEISTSQPPGLEARVIRAPQAVPTPAPSDARDLDCTQAEAAKIERFLGISRDAGMSDAIRWAESDDPIMRKFAISILRDIGTPEANGYLRTLSRDPDRNVAMAATSVSRVKTPSAYPTILGELIPLTPGYPPAK